MHVHQVPGVDLVRLGWEPQGPALRSLGSAGRQLNWQPMSGTCHPGSRVQEQEDTVKVVISISAQHPGAGGVSELHKVVGVQVALSAVRGDALVSKPSVLQDCSLGKGSSRWLMKT